MTTRTVILPGPFDLECGRSLPSLRLAYDTWGEPGRGGAILVLHALTGSSRAASTPEGGGWWEGLVGPGLALDPDKNFILCANLPGSCYGSTGPSDSDLKAAGAWGPDFPLVTTRDMARAHKALLDHLGIERISLAVGGSLGALIAWELAAEFPDLAERIAPVAGTLQATAWTIGLNAVARRAITQDPSWEGGRYTGRGPEEGLALARAIAMLSYRTAELFDDRFGLELVESDPARLLERENLFQVESYLAYQGRKLVGRFDARSYLALSAAMDHHDLGRGRGGLDTVLGRIRAEVLAVGIDSDRLYLPAEVRKGAERLTAAGGRACYAEMTSRFGHDAFLAEPAALGDLLVAFLGKGSA